MELRVLGVAVVLLLVMLSLGCLSPPSPPISRIPKVLVDYSEETGLFTVYVHGMSDYRYERINMTLDNNTVFDENQTYCAVYQTNLSSFNFSISVTDISKQGASPENYFYNASVALFTDFHMFMVVDKHGEHDVDLQSSSSFVTTMEYVTAEGNR